MVLARGLVEMPTAPALSKGVAQGRTWAPGNRGGGNKWSWQVICVPRDHTCHQGTTLENTRASDIQRCERTTNIKDILSRLQRPTSDKGSSSRILPQHVILTRAAALERLGKLSRKDLRQPSRDLISK